jgi:hypothetical protein
VWKTYSVFKQTKVIEENSITVPNVGSGANVMATYTNGSYGSPVAK